jgi:hypothetical protein
MAEKEMIDKYFIVYSKIGAECRDDFLLPEGAVKDFRKKRELGQLGYFDDRFVIGIVDANNQSAKLNDD